MRTQVRRTPRRMPSSALSLLRTAATAALALLCVTNAHAQQWKLDSNIDGSARMVHYNASNAADGWDLAVNVANGTQVTILAQTVAPTSTGNSRNNTAPSGSGYSLPLGDPIVASDGTSRDLVAIANASQATWSPFVTRYSGGSYYGAPGIAAVTLPVTLTTLGNYAFAQWTEFNNPSFTTIPSHVTNLGRGVFSQWEKYNQPFTWPAHLTVIPAFCCYFWRTFDSTFTFAGDVTEIGESALREWVKFNQPFSLPSTVDTLGANTFAAWTHYCPTVP